MVSPGKDPTGEADVAVQDGDHVALVHPEATVLDYSNSYWGDDKSAEVVEAARQARGPTRLDLRGNCFEAGGARALATLLRSTHHVVDICLEWNNVGLLDQGVEALAGALEADTRLLALDLRNNNIGPEGARALARALRRNRSLRTLDLRWNEMGNAGVLALCEALQSNQTLLTLEVTGNSSSLQHADELEALLVRNRAIAERPRPLAVDASCQPEPAKNNASASDDQQDQLLLHVLAEKEELQTQTALDKREIHRMSETLEDVQTQLEQARRDAAVAKEERERFQQREVDAKKDGHELKMHLEELESRRRLEFEDYRSARTALERELSVLRDNVAQQEALHAKTVAQKDKLVAQLEDAKYALDGDLHRVKLALRAQEEEVAKLQKQLQDAQQDFARKEATLVSERESSKSATQRQHELAIGSLQTQLSYTSSQLEASERAVRELKDKSEDLQAKLLQTQLDHEKAVGAMKQQWEAEMQERIQRSVGSVEAQVAEVKKARLYLEHEVAQHLETIIQLRQENVSLQQAGDEKQRELQHELETQYKRLQEQQSLLAAALSEKSRGEEKLQLQLRRLKEQDDRLAQTKGAFEERISDLVASAKTAAEDADAAMKEKATAVAALESHVRRLERCLSAQTHEHEKRMDDLAESFSGFVQEQVRKERERRQAAATDSSTDA